jgi:ATP-binding cassette subfamily F protein 3
MTGFSVDSVTKGFGAQTVLQNISFDVPAGSRAGIVGPNGGGKSTLLKMLAGLEQPDSGHIGGQGAGIGYLAQQADLPEDNRVLTAVLDGAGRVAELETELRRLEADMQDPGADIDGLLKRYGTLQSEYEHLDGYTLEAQAKMMLNGLEMPEDTWARQVSTLSGGQKMRVALARLLMARPEALLLDEPTNHLDMGGIAWLAKYLKTFPGTIVVVSHDRYFLDEVVTQIIEVFAARIFLYTGNYATYTEQKRLRTETAEKLIESQTEEIDRLQKLADKFRYGTRSVQARNYERRAEQMRGEREGLESGAIGAMPRKQRTMRLRLGTERELISRRTLTVDRLSFGYDDKPLFVNFSAKVFQGERIAIVGPNGCGKTTLLRVLLGQLKPMAGRVTFAPGVEAGYFAQEPPPMDSERSILDYAMYELGFPTIEAARTYLGRFLFSGEEVYKELRVLSGGERSRLSLAQLIKTGGNVLFLDEPTNHLDLPAREALEQALLNFDGTIFIVSHDRYLIDRLATRIWGFDEQDGLIDWDQGLAAFLNRNEPGVTASVPAKPRNETKKTGSRGDAAHFARIRAEMATLEEQIEQWQRTRLQQEELLAKPETYRDEAKRESVQDLYNRAQQEIDRLYNRWVALAAECDSEEEERG